MERPRDVSSTSPKEHWRKYPEFTGIRYINEPLYLSRYDCREWNPRHTGSERPAALDIAHVAEWTLPNCAFSTPQTKVLWGHDSSWCASDRTR